MSPTIAVVGAALAGLSTAYVVWDSFVNKNPDSTLKLGLALTIVLGALFTCIQAYEYAHAAFSFGGSIYGSTFFMLTGFHGFHVTVGAIMLTVIWFRCLKGHFTPTHHFAFEGVAWYWHFVDVVWLGLFVFVYWL